MSKTQLDQSWIGTQNGNRESFLLYSSTPSLSTPMLYGYPFVSLTVNLHFPTAINFRVPFMWFGDAILDHYLKLRGLAPGWLIPSRRNVIILFLVFRFFCESISFISCFDCRMYPMLNGGTSAETCQFSVSFSLFSPWLQMDLGLFSNWKPKEWPSCGFSCHLYTWLTYMELGNTDSISFFCLQASHSILI